MNKAQLTVLKTCGDRLENSGVEKLVMKFFINIEEKKDDFFHVVIPVHPH